MPQPTLVWFFATATAVLAWMHIEPAAAHACSCQIGRGGVVSWPLADAQDVPLDTALVISLHDLLDGEPDSVEFTLVDDAGSEVALREVHRLPQPDLDCWAREVVFVRPAEPLQPETTYTVRIGGPPDLSFTTGTETSEPQALEPTLDYLYVGSTRERSAGDPPDCLRAECDLAEIRIDFGGPTERPVWIALRSQANAHEENRARFWPEREELIPFQDGFAVQLAVALPEGSRCVEVTVIDIDGTLLLDEERCEPDECVIWGSSGFSTCGGPHFSSLDATQITGTSCDAPLRLRATDNGQPEYPDGTNYRASESPGGCSASPTPRSSSPLAASWLLLALWALRRRAPHEPRSL